MLKRLARSDAATRLASVLIGLYIRLVYGTSRWTMTGFEHFDAAAKGGKGFARSSVGSRWRACWS